MSRLQVVCVGLLVAGALGACSSDSKSSSTTAVAPPDSATTLPTSPSTEAGSGGAPTDACSIVTTDDVVAAFGGTVAAGVINPDNDGCDYEITGTTNTGDVGIFAEVSVEYGQSDYITATEAKVVFPELVEVPGVGDEAWYLEFGNQLHVSLRGTELLVSVILPGDAAAIQAEVVAFTKVVVGNL
ncbi:hypothetical protein BH10ACT2_BH10ACT2_15270 [soil metagenome]